MFEDKRFENYTSYIGLPYVKYIKSAGARVVPLIPSQGIDHILSLIPKLNGVLFPGGNAGYVEIAEPVFREIIK